jgi:OmpA-OmpF porin, OOP family
MRHRYLLGAGVALAVAMSWANAQATGLGFLSMPGGPGAWYFGGEGGWTMLEDQTGKIGPFKIKQTFSDGFNVGARAGYAWGPWRFEEEFRFQQNDQNRLSIGPFSVKANGSREAYAVMSNLIYDFTLGWPITPHIGAGVGAVGLHDGFGINGFGTVASNTVWEFGYQGIAGVRYNINPALAFDIDYRYLGTTDPTFHTRPFHIPYTSGYSTHSVVASLSVMFGAPPPPPPPPLPPVPPILARKVFLVFFDWDRDTITPEGMAIVQQAAAAFRAGGPVTIQVTGYTDASGSAGYNQRLSERRANNVANAMAHLGVPRQAMSISGRGKNDQRVPTADGVREPQNRRVEIVFP